MSHWNVVAVRCLQRWCCSTSTLVLQRNIWAVAFVQSNRVDTIQFSCRCGGQACIGGCEQASDGPDETASGQGCIGAGGGDEQEACGPQAAPGLLQMQMVSTWLQTMPRPGVLGAEGAQEVRPGRRMGANM